MTMSKLKSIAAVALILGASAGGVGVVAQHAGGAAKEQSEVDRLHVKLAQARARVKTLEAQEIERAEQVRSLTHQLRAARTDQAAKPPGMWPGMAGMPGMKGIAGAGGMMAGAGGMADMRGMAGAGGMMPGMMGMAGDRAESGVNSLISDSVIMATSPERDRVNLLNIETGERLASYQAEEGTTIMPIRNNDLLALHVEGPKITRIAVFEPQTWKWYPQDLREPTSDKARPVAFQNNMAIYCIGRYTYAFSAPARRWDVLELEQGAKYEPSVSDTTATIKHAGRLFIFQAKTGRWVGFDTRTGETIPTDSKPAEKDDPSQTGTP
jgi:hypothetical protein